jgi:hypothetical protein
MISRRVPSSLQLGHVKLTEFNTIPLEVVDHHLSKTYTEPLTFRREAMERKMSPNQLPYSKMSDQ